MSEGFGVGPYGEGPYGAYRDLLSVFVEPETASVRIELVGGAQGEPVYVLRRDRDGVQLVREASEGTQLWPGGAEQLTLRDYEARQGESAMYIVTDRNGTAVASVTVQLPQWGTWLKSPGRPFRNLRVYYGSDSGIKRTATRLVVPIEGAGQRVVFGQARANAEGTITLITRTAAQADKLHVLVGDGMTLMLDTPASWGVPFRYVSVGDIGIDRGYEFDGLGLTLEARAWVLSDLIEVEPPMGLPVGDPGRTYDTLPTLFSSYVAITATTDTYEKLATGEV